MITITFNKATATPEQLAFLKKVYVAKRTRATVTVLGAKHVIFSVQETGAFVDIDVRIELSQLRTPVGVKRDLATNQPSNLRILPCCRATYEFLIKQGWSDHDMVTKGWAEWV